MRGPVGLGPRSLAQAPCASVGHVGYLAWSLLPVGIAILISFNSGRSNASFQGFSLQWWNGTPSGDVQGSLFKNPELHAAIYQTLRLSFVSMFIAVPLGVAFAIAIDRWHGRPAAGANFVMLVSFVIPEIIIGVAMALAFRYLLKFVHLGTIAQVIGLVAFQISYPVIVVRARLLTIPSAYEEAALDLGAPPKASLRRILLPMLYPAIFASFALVFADVIDDFVTVRYLSGRQQHRDFIGEDLQRRAKHTHPRVQRRRHLHAGVDGDRDRRRLSPVQAVRTRPRCVRDELRRAAVTRTRYSPSSSICSISAIDPAPGRTLSASRGIRAATAEPDP